MSEETKGVWPERERFVSAIRAGTSGPSEACVLCSGGGPVYPEGIRCEATPQAPGFATEMLEICVWD